MEYIKVGKKFDDYVEFYKKTVNIIAGRPLMGKNTLTLFLFNQLIKNYEVGYIDNNIVGHLFNNTFIKNLNTTKNCLFMKKKGLKIYHLEKFIIQYLKKRKNVDCIIISCLQGFITPDFKYNERVIKRIKKIAIKYNLCIIINSSISRTAELRENKRPIISDLREKNLIKYFDNIIMLYRDGYYNGNVTKYKIEPFEINIVQTKLNNTKYFTYLPNFK